MSWCWQIAITFLVVELVPGKLFASKVGFMSRWWLSLVVCSLVVCFGSSVWAQEAAPQSPSVEVGTKPEDPAGRSIDANLYMQTSAEYRAACYQAFNLASLRLEQKLAKPTNGKPRAVVLDLDETVFDNRAFQTAQTRAGVQYDQTAWSKFEQTGGHLVELIPGAKEFIQEAESKGVVAVYISNRNNDAREQTKQVLKRLGLPLANEDCLKLADRSTGSNKTSRREAVESKFSVLLYAGDNLRDFDERFVARKPSASPTAEELDQIIADRKTEVDKTSCRFGDDWIILPNPAYGEWPKPLNRGRADLDRLFPHPTPASSSTP